MPFTFSHPAIIIPLIGKCRKIFSASGLVIGSIIPDFESFIRLNEHKIYSHTWPGIFWFDLPLAIVFSFVFHNIIRNPLIDNLPGIIGDKFKRFKDFNWNYYFRTHVWVVIYSMVLGIALHLLWDAFTHLNLANPDAVDSDITLWGVQLFKILQDLNSVLGLAAVVWYIAFMPVPHVAEVPSGKYIYQVKNESRGGGYKKVAFWVMVSMIALILVAAAISVRSRQLSFVLLIHINIAGGLFGLTVASLIRKLQNDGADS